MSTMRTASMRGLGGSTPRGLAFLDTAPEPPLRGDDEVLIERIGMGLDLDPFALPVMAEHSSCRPTHRQIKTPAVFRAINSIKISPKRVGETSSQSSRQLLPHGELSLGWAYPLLDGRYSQRARQFKSLSVWRR
jgi:hypothetical protein